MIWSEINRILIWYLEGRLLPQKYKAASIILLFFVFYAAKNSQLCCFLFHFVIVHPLFSLTLGHLCSPLAPICSFFVVMLANSPTFSFWLLAWTSCESSPTTCVHRTKKGKENVPLYTTKTDQMRNDTQWVFCVFDTNQNPISSPPSDPWISDQCTSYTLAGALCTAVP